MLNNCRKVGPLLWHCLKERVKGTARLKTTEGGDNNGLGRRLLPMCPVLMSFFNLLFSNEIPLMSLEYPLVAIALSQTIVFKCTVRITNVSQEHQLSDVHTPT